MAKKQTPTPADTPEKTDPAAAADAKPAPAPGHPHRRHQPAQHGTGLVEVLATLQAGQGAGRVVELRLLAADQPRRQVGQVRLVADDQYTVGLLLAQRLDHLAPVA